MRYGFTPRTLANAELSSPHVAAAVKRLPADYDGFTSRWFPRFAVAEIDPRHCLGRVLFKNRECDGRLEAYNDGVKHVLEEFLYLHLHACEGGLSRTSGPGMSGDHRLRSNPISQWFDDHLHLCERSQSIAL